MAARPGTDGEYVFALPSLGPSGGVTQRLRPHPAGLSPHPPGQILNRKLRRAGQTSAVQLLPATCRSVGDRGFPPQLQPSVNDIPPGRSSAMNSGMSQRRSQSGTSSSVRIWCFEPPTNQQEGPSHQFRSDRGSIRPVYSEAVCAFFGTRVLRHGRHTSGSVSRTPQGRRSC